MNLLVRSGCGRIAYAFVAVVVATAFGGKATPSLYERVATRLAARTDLADVGQPPPQLRDVEWLLGTWSIDVKVMATSSTSERIEHGESRITHAMDGHWLQMTDSYPAGTQDLGFLTFNRFTRQWVTVSLDSHGNVCVARADGWRDDRLTFVIPEQEILGEKATLRQTLRRLSFDEFVVLNEEQLPDGAWRAVDEYRYRRKDASVKTSP